MDCYIFDGKAFAAHKERVLSARVQELKRVGVKLNVKTFTFLEDEGSRLYTKLKKEAASRIGISYEPVELSLSDDLGYIVQTIREASVDAELSGIMIQKPAKAVWESEMSTQKRQVSDFQKWWEEVTNAIDPTKDVDCLTERNLRAVGKGALVIPATAQACLSILQEAQAVAHLDDETWKRKSIVVLGRSDIVGKPVTYLLRSSGHAVENFGQKELASIGTLERFDIVISATGVPHLLTGSMIRDGAVVIDVGSPRGDVDRASVEPKASFLTPVPGGVGPVTVVSLMENIIVLSENTADKGFGT